TGTIGFLVALGMAFSKMVRTVVALLLPSFCTSKGRTIIMAFCMMLLVTGPTTNITYNYKQMSRSLTCGDELGYNVSQAITMLKGLKALVHDGQNAVLSTMEDTVDTIIEAVESPLELLKHDLKMWNTLWQRYPSYPISLRITSYFMQTAQEMYTEFAANLQSIGRVVNRMNHFIRNMGSVCSQKLGSFLCIIPRFVAKQAKKLITAPVKKAIERIKAEFKFNMSYSYEFKYDMNSSKSISDITNDILTEVKGDLKHVTSAFEWLRFAMGFSIVVVILKALKYRHKYLTVIKFDNFYITDKFIKLDKRRKRKEEIAVLPLRARENSFYVSPNRIWMSRRELKKFTKGMSLLTFGFLYTLAVIFVDYSFYWLLQKITNSLTLREQAGSPTLISLSIVGPGFVSVIYRRSIASALDRLASSEGYNFAMDKCLPIAKHPDYIVYAVIISLYLLCYVICIVESYVLRSRRRIMATFHPKRERARILFLRAKILRGRGVGPDARMKNSLKKACLEAQKNAEKEKVGLADRLASYSGSKSSFYLHLLKCHVCKVAGGAKHAKFFTSCERFGCKGRYCIECFEDMHRLCLLC
uniref:Uncharacterized protein n=1 Tax=Ciona intestinalis TaxID=7719 RepID=F6Q249_CIOIN